jgi:NAD(P)H-dependent flavin oxidoreductase YrpB (nitropropane dioxygenase family)
MLVAAGGEAGGHCGDVSTLVLLPEILSVAGNTPVLAAGGIVTGEQMAACMSMGAAGAWCGSVWVPTVEGETSKVIKQKLIEASSRDTIRSKTRTGKFSRQLKSDWTQTWQAKGPDPLPLPLQSILTEPALQRIQELAEQGHPGAIKLATYWIGQGIGLIDEIKTVENVMNSFKKGYIEAAERLNKTLKNTD